MTVDEVRTRAGSVVADVLKLMGIGAEIETVLGPLDGEVTVNVKAEAEGLLIGRRGQTLDAVEHVINRMVIPHDAVSEVRVSIDVGGYRDRRRESLAALAERLKTRALDENRRVQVSPMNARDRAVFEDALAQDDRVETRVLGSGLYRRMLVLPAGLEDEDPATRDTASGDSLDPKSSGEPQESVASGAEAEPTPQPAGEDRDAQDTASAEDRDRRVPAGEPRDAVDEAQAEPLPDPSLDAPSKDGD